MNQAVIYALLAAVLFGASTPFAKLLTGGIAPILLAGLLYLGSGVGLAAARIVRDRGWRPSGMKRSEWPWLIGAIGFGGILGPIALMFGLTETSGAVSSLLLNLEAVFTALLAWVAFKENADLRIVTGMVLIVAASVVLSWPSGQIGPGGGYGATAIAFACLCWAIDNNLTRKVSASDALFLAGAKGLAAGIVNVLLALKLGAQLPSAPTVLAAMGLGLSGYGISLVLFVLALRGLGSARTGAYFSMAPFVGAAISLPLLGEQPGWPFWAALVLMAIGIWLHITERHAHEHTHEALEHTHRHVHDTHHQHEHPAGWDGREPHTHLHRHEAITHSHAHFPDIHHRHRH